MKRKPKLRWALVGSSGAIHSGYLAFSRRAVIEKVLADHRTFTRNNGAGLSDAQFWRQIKCKRNYSVRRISMKVVR